MDKKELAYQALFDAISGITFPAVNRKTSFVYAERRNIQPTQLKPADMPCLFFIQGMDIPQHQLEGNSYSPGKPVEVILKCYSNIWITTGSTDPSGTTNRTFASTLMNGILYEIEKVLKPFPGQPYQRLGGNVAWVYREKTVFGDNPTGNLMAAQVHYKMKIYEGNM